MTSKGSTGGAADELVTLITVETWFQSQLIVAVLEGAEIEAHGLETPPLDLGLSPARGRHRVPVQVRRSTLERAHAVLKARISESIDLDWSEVDVGRREDDLPLARPGRIPLAARIAFAVTVAIALLSMIAGAIALFA